MVDYRRIEEIAVRVMEENPLPANLDELEPADRRRLEELAAKNRVTPVAMLHLARTEHERIVADSRLAWAVTDEILRRRKLGE